MLGLLPEGTEWSLEKRIKISALLHPILLAAIIVMCIQDSQEVTPLEYIKDQENISLPKYSIIKTNFPENLNRGDDYCIDQTVKFKKSPSCKDIGKINAMCGRKEDGTLYYRKDFYGGEEVIIIEFDLQNNIAYTRYHKR